MQTWYVILYKVSSNVRSFKVFSLPLLTTGERNILSLNAAILSCYINVLFIYFNTLKSLLKRKQKSLNLAHFLGEIRTAGFFLPVFSTPSRPRVLFGTCYNVDMGCLCTCYQASLPFRQPARRPDRLKILPNCQADRRCPPKIFFLPFLGQSQTVTTTQIQILKKIKFIYFFVLPFFCEMLP